MDTSDRDSKHLVASSYDRIAERYLEWRADHHREGAAPWVSMLAERLLPRSQVLDIGCGAGIPLTRALAAAYDVTGVDISARQIELARRNVPNARFIHGDISTIEFRAATFDAAVASYSLIHLPRAEHESIFQNIARWLRPGGFLLANFGTSNRAVVYDDNWLGQPMFWSNYDADGERKALAAAGFELLLDRIETEIEDGHPLRWLLILARTKP